jgi:hypothetical protein
MVTHARQLLDSINRTCELKIERFGAAGGRELIDSSVDRERCCDGMTFAVQQATEFVADAYIRNTAANRAVFTRSALLERAGHAAGFRARCNRCRVHCSCAE